MERESERSSRFNVYLPEDGGKPAVWNAYTDELLSLEPCVYEALKANALDNLTSAQRERLWASGFLAPAGLDEYQQLSEDDQRFAELSPQYYQIFVTTACNARCAYCYEKGIRGACMDERTAEQTARYIIQRYAANTARTPVSIEWFGGEPTLNPQAISHISDRLQEAGVLFSSSCCTNGILLNRPMVLEAKQLWALSRVQITVDGAYARYAAIKGVPEDTFERVLANIDTWLAHDISVSVRINYTGDTEAAQELIQALHARYPGGWERLRVYIAPLYESCKAISRATMSAVLSLSQRLVSVGLASAKSVYRLPRRQVRCMAATINGHTIAPDGGIYNCAHCVRDGGRVGSVWDEDERSAAREQFLAPMFPDACRSCALLPVCRGGCRAAELGMAPIQQCHPYKNVLDLVLRERLQWMQTN